MTIADRIKALQRKGPIALDVYVELESIGAEVERIAGEHRGFHEWASSEESGVSFYAGTMDEGLVRFRDNAKLADALAKGGV